MNDDKEHVTPREAALARAADAYVRAQLRTQARLRKAEARERLRQGFVGGIVSAIVYGVGVGILFLIDQRLWAPWIIVPSAAIGVTITLLGYRKRTT